MSRSLIRVTNGVPGKEWSARHSPSGTLYTGRFDKYGVAIMKSKLGKLVFHTTKYGFAPFAVDIDVVHDQHNLNILNTVIPVDFQYQIDRIIEKTWSGRSIG
jgi:hypothetical protein